MVGHFAPVDSLRKFSDPIIAVQTDWKTAVGKGIHPTYPYLEPICPLFLGWKTLQNKAFSDQNTGPHLGSRYTYINFIRLFRHILFSRIFEELHQFSASTPGRQMTCFLLEFGPYFGGFFSPKIEDNEGSRWRMNPPIYFMTWMSSWKCQDQRLLSVDYNL